MNTFFLPPPTYVRQILDTSSFQTLNEWCEQAQIPCKASGGWTNQRLGLIDKASLCIEIDQSGQIGIGGLKFGETPTTIARYVLCIAAYHLHNLVAKESVRGRSWAKVTAPKGRVPQARVKTNAERQRTFRAKTKAVRLS